MNFSTSEKLFEEAEKHLVGGVNSPVRAFKYVGGKPLFITHAKGSHIWDADGNEYIDYVGSWGPAILGHAPPTVLHAIQEASKKGLSFGAPHTGEIELAQLVKKTFPSIELVRFVSSGTEAAMGAIRAARGFTNRKKIIKFDGCYHGHADYLLVKAGSGAATLGVPDSAGVPEEFVQATLVALFNDIESVKKIFAQNKNQIAAVIVEPVVGNMGCIPPEKNFLENLCELARNEKTPVIFDEVMTGFRLAFGGAQELFNIKPDLTCLGKIIGGGLPVGAYGGRREIMALVAPMGPVYQAGTLSGNPLAMAAGVATLTELQKAGTYHTLEEKGAMLEEAVSALSQKSPVPFTFNRVGSMFSFFFAKEKVSDADSARKSDKNLFAKFFHGMLAEGIYLAPSPFEAAFLSLAHTDEDLEKTSGSFKRVLSKLS